MIRPWGLKALPVILPFFILPSLALAAITPGSISVSSYANPVIDGVTTATVYAGYADSGGSTTCTSGGVPTGDGVSPCDSCSQMVVDVCSPPAAGIACNTRNVYGTLPLYISFAINDASKITKGTSAIKAATTSFTDLSIVQSTGTTAVADIDVNTTLTAKILWSSIFSEVAGQTTTPITSFSKTFYIGVAKSGTALASTDDYFTVKVNYRAPVAGTYDPAAPHTDCGTTTGVAGEGVCGFGVRAGDKKVYINSVFIPKSTWPDPGDAVSVSYTGMRVYYAKSTSFCDIKLSTAGFADLVVDSSGNLPVAKIFNLENDQNYVFLASTLDQAGNVTRFSSQTYLGAETVYKHHAMPGEVVGLLDGKKCFIATAAFGSEMDPQVDVIRKFRNQFLLPHGWGRSFVRWYYQASPPLAAFIAQHEGFRTVVRGLLWPVVFVSSVSVEHGIFVAFLMVGLSLTLVFLAGCWARRLLEKLKAAHR